MYLSYTIKDLNNYSAAYNHDRVLKYISAEILICYIVRILYDIPLINVSFLRQFQNIYQIFTFFFRIFIKISP